MTTNRKNTKRVQEALDVKAGPPKTNGCTPPLWIPTPSIPIRVLDRHSARPPLPSDKTTGFRTVTVTLLSVLLLAVSLFLLRLDSLRLARESTPTEPASSFATEDLTNGTLEHQPPGSIDNNPGFASGDPDSSCPGNNAETSTEKKEHLSNVSMVKKLFTQLAVSLNKPANNVENPSHFEQTKNRIHAQRADRSVNQRADRSVIASTQRPTPPDQPVSDQANVKLLIQSISGPVSTARLAPAEIRNDAPFYGTRIKWHRLTDAAVIASRENKLVFLMHVSGNFAKEEFT